MLSTALHAFHESFHRILTMTTTKQETGAITILQIRKLKCRERRSVKVKQVADLRLTLKSFCLQNTGRNYEPLGFRSNENTGSTGQGKGSKREPAPFDDLFIYTTGHPPRASGDLIIVCFLICFLCLLPSESSNPCQVLCPDLWPGAIPENC